MHPRYVIVNVNVNVNELRLLGFSNTTRNPEGILVGAAQGSG
jgi:hypothetical protein